MASSSAAIESRLKQGRMNEASARGSWSLLPGGQRSAHRLPTESTIRTWNDMILFLREFIDNNFGAQGLRRTVKEPSYFEQMLNLPPNLTMPNQPSVFYPDRYYEFTKVLFLGQERELMLLNLLSYALFDLWFGSTAVSILLCFLLDLGLSHARHYYSRVRPPLCIFLTRISSNMLHRV